MRDLHQTILVFLGVYKKMEISLLSPQNVTDGAKL